MALRRCRCLLALLTAAALLLQADPAAAFTKSDCYFPFLYNGTEYYYCTRNAYYTLWCSLDRVYQGRWTVCGPEVPKEVLDSIKTAMDEVGKEKAKLAAEQLTIDSVAKSVRQLANASENAQVNRTTVLAELDRRLGALNRTLLELELIQRNLDRRQSNQESLQPLEIGMMTALTAAVTLMGVALFALHCSSNSSSNNRPAAAAAAVAQKPGSGNDEAGSWQHQLGSLSLRRVQPVQPAAASAAAAPDAKQFPGHFYRLTIDEETPGEEEDVDDEAEEEADEEEADDEEDDGQHSAAAAVLGSDPKPTGTFGRK